MNMIPKVELIKMFRHLKKRGRNIPDNKLIHPIRDWTIGLGVTSFIFVVSSNLMNQKREEEKKCPPQAYYIMGLALG